MPFGKSKRLQRAVGRIRRLSAPNADHLDDFRAPSFSGAYSSWHCSIGVPIRSDRFVRMGSSQKDLACEVPLNCSFDIPDAEVAKVL